MSNRTTANTPLTGTPIDVTTDERVVALLSDGVAAKVQYVAEIDGTPDSSNVGIIDAAGARRVAIADGGDVTMGAKAATAWDLIVADPTMMAVMKKIALLVGDAASVSIVRPEALTKGTQGANGLATQDLKDAGRLSISMIGDRFHAGQATEELIDMTTQQGFAARSGTVTSYTVTAGKTLRFAALWAAMSGVAGNSATAFGILRLRVNTAGAAIITSPIAKMWILSGTAGAAAAVGAFTSSAFPDCIEVPAGAGMAWTIEIPSWVITTTDPNVSFDFTAFEY